MFKLPKTRGIGKNEYDSSITKTQMQLKNQTWVQIFDDNDDVHSESDLILVD